MWLLLFIPILIVGVLVLSVGAVFAELLLEHAVLVPMLLIGVGIWMLVRDDGRHPRRARWGHGRRHLRQPAWAEQQKHSDVTQDLRSTGQPDLPVDVAVKVEQIRRKVDVLLSYADRFPPFSRDLYLVRQTASDYLPRTINAYLALPRQTATDKPLSPDGNTAYHELKAQLDLLDTKLDDIADDLQRQDTDRLLANRRFLESRFGDREPKPALDPETTGVA